MSRALALVASVVVARLLGKEGYGELGIIQGTISMFGVLAGLGLGATATKFVAEYRVKDPARAGRVIGFCNAVAMGSGFLMSLALTVFAPWLAEHTLAAPHLSRLIQISSWMLFLGAWGAIQNSVLAALEAFKRMAAVALWTGVLSFPLSIVGVWGWGLDGAVWALLAAQFLGCLLAGSALRTEARKAGVRLAWEGCLNDWRRLMNYSLPSLLNGVLVWPVNWFCSVLLVNQSHGYAEMGAFNAANQWRTMILFVPNALMGMAFPVLSNLWGEQNRTGFRKAVLTVLGGNVLIASLLAVGMSLSSDMMLRLYGAQYANATPVLSIVALSSIPISITICCGQAIAALGRMWTSAALTLGWAAVTIVLTWFLVPAKLGIGLAAVQAAAATFLAALQVLALWIAMKRGSGLFGGHGATDAVIGGWPGR